MKPPKCVRCNKDTWNVSNLEDVGNVYLCLECIGNINILKRIKILEKSVENITAIIGQKK